MLVTLTPVRRIRRSRWLGRLLCSLGLLLAAPPCHAQDIEPRRWSHLPLDANFLGVGYAYTYGDIILNPVLQIEDGEFDVNTYALKYIKSFGSLRNPPASTSPRSIRAANGPACRLDILSAPLVTAGPTPPCALR